MRIVSTSEAPIPKGHYSQAIVHGGVVYVAGQLATDPTDPDRAVGGPGEQTRLIFRNIAAILDAAGSSLDRLLQVTIYVTDGDFWSEVNAAFAEALGDHRPTRAIIPIASLPAGKHVEIVAVAALKD